MLILVYQGQLVSVKMDGATYRNELPLFLNNAGQLEVEDSNGLCLANVYIPEEILLDILTYIDPKDLLKYCLVCRKWNNLIKSFALWSKMYRQKYNRKAKRLPWYLYYCLLSTNYFNTNLLVNGNGQDRFKNWICIRNGGDKWAIEDPPIGSDRIPLDVPEFNNKTSCFATSYFSCYKLQSIGLGKSKLFWYIFDSYKPHIYLSEWTAGRFDSGCTYRLLCGFTEKGGYTGKGSDYLYIDKTCVEHRVDQWEGGQWKKIEMIIEDYPERMGGITFEHEGKDTQGWAGHYGSKMAGGVVKLLFDSIEALPVDEHGNEIPKKFSRLLCKTNATVVNAAEIGLDIHVVAQASLNRRDRRNKRRHSRRHLIEL